MYAGNRSVTVTENGRIVIVNGVRYRFDQPVIPGKPVRFPVNFPQELREVVGDAVSQMGPVDLTEGR